MYSEWQDFKNHSVIADEITQPGNNHQYMKPWEERLVGNFKWEVQAIIIWILLSVLVTQPGTKSHYMPSELTYIGQYTHEKYRRDFV